MFLVVGFGSNYLNLGPLSCWLQKRSLDVPSAIQNCIQLMRFHTWTVPCRCSLRPSLECGEWGQWLLMTFVWARSWYNIYIYIYMCIYIYTACRYTCLFFKRYIFDYSIQIIYKYENNIHNNRMYIYIYLLLLCGRANDITHPAIVNPA